MARSLLPLFAAGALALPHARDATNAALSIDWNDILIESKTSATLQVVSMPPYLEGSDVREQIMSSLDEIADDYVRFVPWFPYPQLAVPEIDAPVMNDNECKTSWNFTFADQLLGDFLEHTKGKKQIINFSTTPGWLWDVQNYTYPEDPTEIDFDYNQGTQLRDPSMKEVADYYRRLLGWYTNGGFEDECGVYHESGHHYDFQYWEVLNEPDSEHTFSPDEYNKLYDAVTSAILDVAPHMKFVGGGLAFRNATWVESIMDPKNHAEGTPLEWVSYHWYGAGEANATTEEQARQVFASVDSLLDDVDALEAAKRRVNPNAKTTMNEVGTMDPNATTNYDPNYVIPEEYWAWSAGVCSLVFCKLILKEIDVVGQSQLYGYGGQYPSVSLVDPETGKLQARARALQLMEKNFAPGDKLAKTDTGEDTVFAQAFLKPDGSKKVLIVNKENQEAQVSLPEFKGGKADIIKIGTGAEVPESVDVRDSLTVPPYGTVVISK